MIKFESFELAADAWDWLDDNGFVQRTSEHREFDHPDGRWAILFPPEEEGSGEETEVKIFPAPDIEGNR